MLDFRNAVEQIDRVTMKLYKFATTDLKYFTVSAIY